MMMTCTILRGKCKFFEIASEVFYANCVPQRVYPSSQGDLIVWILAMTITIITVVINEQNGARRRAYKWEVGIECVRGKQCYYTRETLASEIPSLGRTKVRLKGAMRLFKRERDSKQVSFINCLKLACTESSWVLRKRLTIFISTKMLMIVESVANLPSWASYSSGSSHHSSQAFSQLLSLAQTQTFLAMF